MKLILPLNILFLVLSFENILAFYGLLDNGENKKYKRDINSFFIKNLALKMLFKNWWK